MARCHPRNADSAPSTRSAPTCSNSRNDRQPHARLSSRRQTAATYGQRQRCQFVIPLSVSAESRALLALSVVLTAHGTPIGR